MHFRLHLLDYCAKDTGDSLCSLDAHLERIELVSVSRNALDDLLFEFELSLVLVGSGAAH